MKDKIFDRLLKWFKSWWAIIVLLTIALISFAFAAPECSGKVWICNLLGVKEKGEAIKMLGFTLLALLGIYVANRRAIAMDKTAEAQKKTVEGDTERRIQERFRDAVKLLGHEKESVRLGGAYALFHLALEEKSLRKSIAEILCAHIRETTRGEEYREKYRNRPSTEIQSLMTLLFEGAGRNKSETLKKFWKDISPNLSGGFFQGIKLEKAQFQGAFLDNTQFQGAKIWESQFQGAKLLGAQFQKATLWHAQFQGANLQNAQFQGAELLSVQLQGAVLISTQFQGASIHNAGFQGACLWGAHFQEVDFHGAKYQGAFSSLQPAGDFQSKIKSRTKAESELFKVIFAGGLKQEDIDKITSQLEGIMPENKVASFKADLEPHIGPRRDEIPNGVEKGEYSQEEANQWIADYEKAMNWEKDT